MRNIMIIKWYHLNFSSTFYLFLVFEQKIFALAHTAAWRARLSLHGYFCPRKYVGNGELLVQMYLGKWDNCLLLLCSRLNLWHYYYGYG